MVSVSIEIIYLKIYINLKQEHHEDTKDTKKSQDKKLRVSVIY